MDFTILTKIKDILNQNSLQDYLIFLAIFVGIFILLKISAHLILLRSKKSKRKNPLTSFIAGFLDHLNPLVYLFFSFYLATSTIELPKSIRNFLLYIILIIIVFYLTKLSTKIVDFLLNKYKQKKSNEEDSPNNSMLNVLGLIIKVAIWILAILIVLTNLGIEITPLIAGLGIGGIAIALALQNILGDLFSAFTIYFDKPFKEGDFIIVGNDMGVIKNIGIKSTRIQALGGQELVISNNELTSTRINNYKKMNTRRVLFSFGVEYNTQVSKLKRIKSIVEEIIKEEKRTKLDRVHFKEFADSSLNFEVVYYVDSNDYNTYMDVQERINLNIKERLEKEKVNFAFPSRTIYIPKN